MACILGDIRGLGNIPLSPPLTTSPQCRCSLTFLSQFLLFPEGIWERKSSPAVFTVRATAGPHQRRMLNGTGLLSRSFPVPEIFETSAVLSVEDETSFVSHYPVYPSVVVAEDVSVSPILFPPPMIPLPTLTMTSLPRNRPPAPPQRAQYVTTSAMKNTPPP